MTDTFNDLEAWFSVTPEDEGLILRAVSGALRTAVHDHGPITSDWTGSAAKRVVGALKSLGDHRQGRAALAALLGRSTVTEGDPR